MCRRRGSAAALLVSLLACMCAVSAQGRGYVDGISDQSLPAWDGSFAASPFAELFRARWSGGPDPQIRLARYVVQWNAMAQETPVKGPSYGQRFEAWLSDAGSLGLTRVLALTSYDGVHPGSAGEYRPRLEALLARAAALGYPIRFLEPWNEPNGQGREDAVSAASFAYAANQVCERLRSCEVIAGDFEDRSSVGPYQQAYQRALGFRPRIWGVHPYVSVESHDARNLRRLLAALPPGQVWFTEVGARYCSRGQVRGEARQASDASYLVDGLLADPTLTPVHAFYYGFLFGYRAQAPCTVGGGEDSELYSSSGAPRAAALVILSPPGATQPLGASASPAWPPWSAAASVMIDPLTDRARGG